MTTRAHLDRVAQTLTLEPTSTSADTTQKTIFSGL